MPGAAEALEIIVVELVAVAVALHDRIAAIDLARPRARAEAAPPARPGACCRPCRMASSRCCAPSAASCHSVMSAITGCGVARIHLGAVRVLKTEHVPAELDHRHLHARGRCPGRECRARARSARPGSCPRRRARRSRPAPGSHPCPASARDTVLLKIGRLDVMNVDARAGSSDPPCISASLSEM